jgi:outer membrane protein OmpA-like peptidoglycan-associated protein
MEVKNKLMMAGMMTGVLGLILAGTGCATKKYVVQTLAPVETRVTATEAKNVDQDKQIAAQGKEIEEIGTDLSRSKERLAADIASADQKATVAGQTATQAGQRADAAQTSANGARTLAQQGIERTTTLERTFDRTIEGLNKYKMTRNVTVQFPVNQYKLSDDAKAQLDDIAGSAAGLERYVIEVQGFTDKSGTADINERLSQERAEAAARYLVNQHKIPVRSINMLGSGYASPVADDSTREGRKQNRRVEVRLFVPEITSAAAVTASN